MNRRARRTSTTSTALVVLLSAGLLGGCSSDPDRRAEPRAGSTASPTRTAPPVAPIPSLDPDLPAVPTSGTGAPSAVAQDYCDGLLPRAAVTDLAGRATGPATVLAVAGLPGCTWEATDDSSTSVQVVNASSSSWAIRLPSLQQGLLAQGTELDDQLQDDLATAADQAANGFEVDADLACEIFTELAVATGSDEGTTAVARVQTQGSTTSVVVEGCSSDEYSYLQLTTADLGSDPAAVTAEAEEALQRVHGAPLQLSSAS